MTNLVECPNCGEEFDAVAASRRINPACPHCRKTWGELHALADPEYVAPEDAEIHYPVDGAAGVVRG